MGDRKMQKNVEEKHSFSYRKLVVPLSMRSIYWKYFGFPANEEEEILTKVKIVCTLCKVQIAYNRNTSNLRMHLQNKHAYELQRLEENAPVKSPSLTKIKQERDVERTREKRERMNKSKSKSLVSLYSRAMEGTMCLEGDVDFLTESSLELQGDDDGEWSGKAVQLIPSKGRHSTFASSEGDDCIFQLDKNAVTEFMIVDLESSGVVEGRGFQSLIATLRSPCEIPGKDKLEEFLIPKVYNTFKDATLQTVTNLAGDVGLILEEWNHSNGEVYITIYVYYQIEIDDTLENKVLTTIHCSPYTDWNAVVNQLISEWSLKVDRVTAVVMGTSQTAIFDAFQEKGFITIPCLVHSLQVCARLIFSQEEVAEVLSRIRCMVSMISQSLPASTSLQIQLQISGLSQNEEATLKMDYPQVWTSTYNMLEKFRQLKDAIETIMSNIEGFAIDKQKVCLSGDDWKIVDDLVTVLEPFKVTMMTLGEEKIPLISLLKPLLWQLNSLHLKRKPTDSETALTFKDMLTEHLEKTYDDYDINMTLQTAMALDPRFKQLPYATDQDKKLVTLNIKTQLAKLVAESNLVLVEEPSPKKSRVSGLEFILGGLCTSQSGNAARTDKGLLELSQYESEAVAALDDCPLTWWSRACVRCPNLGKLAQKYNCVPSSSIPVSRIPTENQIHFDQKRARILPEMIEKLLFLNGNYQAS